MLENLPSVLPPHWSPSEFYIEKSDAYYRIKILMCLSTPHLIKNIIINISFFLTIDIFSMPSNCLLQSTLSFVKSKVRDALWRRLCACLVSSVLM